MSSNAISQEEQFKAGKVLGLDHVKLGMWLFLATEVMFFGGLIGAFLHHKVNTPSPAETALLDVVLVGINTFVLLTSSFTVVMALSSIKLKDVRGLIRNLAFTVILGSIFLAGQGFEFFSLAREGMSLQSSIFGSSFFTLTGFHGLHVTIGVVWGLVALIRASRGDYSADNYQGIEIFGLYWHFVDIVWIVLFTIIYLI
jgi:heme/copper-type cytochrome/quinol oxidase subunit 3